MAFVDIERKNARNDSRTMVTFTPTGNINPNAATTRALQTLGVNFCRFQFDRESLTLRILLLKKPESNTFKIVRSGGNGRTSQSISAKSVLKHIGYDFGLKILYEVTLVHNQKNSPPYMDVVLRPDRFKVPPNGDVRKS